MVKETVATAKEIKKDENSSTVNVTEACNVLTSTAFLQQEESHVCIE